MSSPPNIPVMVLSFGEAESLKIYEFERKAATKLMEVVEKIDCKLVLDKLTKADGNCMIIAMTRMSGTIWRTIQSTERYFKHTASISRPPNSLCSGRDPPDIGHSYRRKKSDSRESKHPNAI